MMKIFVLVFLFPIQAFALDAVITVLEAPLFESPNLDAPVVQYKRKGDIIKLHPSLVTNNDYDDLAPSPEKAEKLKKVFAKQWEKDPLFQGKSADQKATADFTKTFDRRGHEVYILTEHIYIIYKTKKEFTQATYSPDPTDYRLEEPLARKYPLTSPTGYRGQFTFGVTQPYNESYPYEVKAKKKGYTTPLDFNLTLLRQAPQDERDRFFIGGTLNVRTFENDYNFVNRRFASEKVLKIGLGPTLSYDVFKGEKNRVNISGTLLVNLLNQVNITQIDFQGASEQRLYRGITAAPRLAAQYHRKGVMEDLDFVIGTFFEVETPGTFRTNQPASASRNWWNNEGSDSFTTPVTFNLSGYIGIQSAY